MRRDELPGYRDSADPFLARSSPAKEVIARCRYPAAHRLSSSLHETPGVLNDEARPFVVGAHGKRRGGSQPRDYWLAISGKPPSVRPE